MHRHPGGCSTSSCLTQSSNIELPIDPTELNQGESSDGTNITSHFQSHVPKRNVRS